MLTILRRGALLLCTLLATVSAGVHAQAVCSAPGSSGSGTISGIVNTYFQGNGNLAANATTLTLGTRDTRGASTSVTVGTLLLLIQMQDGSINSSNSSLYGDGTGSGQGTLTVGRAGLHEFVTVTATTGTGAGANVTFSPPLTNSYTQAASTGSAGQKRYQVIVVPQYLTATAAGVTAPAWGLGAGATGETGAVVAIDVQAALTLGSASVEGQAGRSIFVAGKGFRGAAGRQSGANGPNTDWVAVATGAHGGKGEGIAGTPRYMAIKGNGFGSQSTNLVASATDLALLDNGEGYPNGSHARGAPGNAGGGGTDGNASGGGNNENSGGGGGGGYAQGGLGGRPWNAPLVDSDGRGGAGYAGILAFNRLFPGGGGGSGGSNDATTDPGTYENLGVSCDNIGAMCSSGAAGGGIVIVRARSVGGSGVIDARGANGYNVSNDAGGGGGGGGAVVIYSIDGGSANVDASGGDGGNAWAGHTGGSPVGDRHGPGGGGGGGFITFAPSSFVLAGTVNGGRPGRTTNGVDDTYSSSGYEGGLTTFQTPNTPGILPGAVCSPDLRLAKSDGTSTLTSGGSAIYALTVSNIGNSITSGTITVVDVLPAALSIANGAVPLSGPQAANWSCSAASNVVTCTSSAPIGAAGTSSFAFAASVTGANGTAVTNLARVGGGGDPNKPAPSGATTAACTAQDNPAGCATDVDTIQAPLLSLSKSDGVTDVVAGGTATYSLVVTNAGALATSGTIRVVDVLPTGMTYTGASPFASGGFNCTWTAGSLSFSCDRTTALAAGASTTISIPVSIAAAAPSSLTNRARAGGGGDPGKTTLPTVATATSCPAPVPPATLYADVLTGCASDVDTVRHVNLVLAKSDGQPFMPINGQTTYTFTVTNNGDASSNGTIFFRDVLPAPMNWPNPLTVGGADAAAWSCTRVNGTDATCTSSTALAPGASSVFSLVANVGAATSGNQYMNRARIGGGGDPELVASPSNADTTACTNDNNPLGCAVDLDTAQNAAQIRLAKTHPDPQARNPGDTFTVSLAVSNTGGSNSGNSNTVRVVDVLPSGLVYSGAATFTSGNFSCSVAAGPPQVVTCDNTARINAGTTSTITFNVTVGAGATNLLFNPAQVGTTGADPQNATLPTATTAATCVGNGAPLIGCAVDPVPLNANLSIAKSERLGASGAFTAGPLSVANGSTVQFQIVASNAGPATVTGAAISDTIPANFTAPSIVSATAAGGATGCTTGAFALVGNALSGTITSLPSGASCTLVVQGTASTNGSATNTAQVVAPAGINDTNTGDNASSVVTNILARPTVQVTKVSLGGTGTFAFSGDNGYPGDSITTLAAGTPVAGLTRTLTAVNVATTITEAAPPAGFVLTQISCSGLGAGSAGIDLANSRVTLSAAAIVPGAAIACTFTNTKQPRITLQKALPNGRADASDQFALSIAGATSATGTTTGAGSAVTSPAVVLTGAAGSYTLSEAMAAGSASTLAKYASAISCTNAASGSPTVLPSGAGTSFPLTVQAGDEISCTLANTATLADLSITKTDGATNAIPGNPISYTIVASNAGPSAVTGATVADTIPAAITGATWTAVYAGGASGPASGSGNVNASVNLPSGGSATFTVSGTISATATGTLANTATIAAPASATDPTPGNNSATDTDTLAPSANLAITKTDGATSATPGATITYTIVASNAGPSTATGAVVTDTLPANITGATWTAAYAGGASGPASGSGNINASVDIPVGGTATFTVTGTINAGASGTLANTATIAPPVGTTDPTPGNNSATDSDTLNASADIRVVKTGPASIGYGGALGYSVVVTNLGPSNANGTTFSDAVPAGITGVSANCNTPTGGAACGAVNVAGNNVTSTITTLPSGGSVTFTINGTAPTSGASVTNSATANPPAGTTDPTPGNNTGTATTNLLQPQLSVTKSATPNPFVVGQPASYTITVSNGGAGPTAGNITIADTLPAGITLANASGANWSCSGTTALSCTYTGTIAAGGSTTLTLDVNVGAGAANGNNSATASGGGDPTCPAQARCTGTTTVPVNPSADIAIAKSVDNPTPNVGETVTFTITASNNGPNAATGVAVTDALPSGVAFVSATPSQGTYTSGTGLWTIGALGNGASATLDIVATVLTPGAITNTATKSAGDQFDPNAGNNAGSASLNAQPSADLQVSKTVDDATPNLGTNVTYTITVANAGPNDATNVSVDDLLPAGLVFVSATPSQGVYDDGVGLWTIGSVAAGDSVTLQIVATVTLPGDITNTATVDADQHDPNTTNNSAGVTLNGQSADIQVLKGVDNANPVRGDTVTFTITATNNGPSAATGVAISDVLPAGLSFVSATPSQGTYNNGTGTWTVGALAASGAGATATLTIVADVDTDSGFTNTASLTALDQTDPNPANNSASVVVTPIASADLSITKTDGSASATPGAPITYTIVASNAGPSPVTGATIVDTLPADIAGASWTCTAAGGASCTSTSGVGDINALADIPAGGSVTFTVTGTIASNASGTIANTATVAPPAGTTDPTPGNNSATDSDALDASANLAISKTDGSGTATPGAPITYTIVASNAGPSDASGVTVTDAIPASITGATWTCVASGTAVCAVPSGSGSINTTVDLPAGTSATFTVAGTISPTATGTLANTATIVPPVGTTDPDPNDDSSTDTDNLTPSADLAITKTDGAASATPGSPISYTIVASNAGPSTATNAIVADTVPAAILGATWTCVGTGGATCPASGSGNINASVTIPASGSVTFTVTGTVSAAASGTLVNTATVTPPAGTTDPNGGDNSATDSDTLAASANLSITKTDGAANATPGSPITYTVVASNAGPSDATGATVADTIPASITGATWTCVGAAGGTCPASGSGNIAATVSLPVGGSVTFTVSGTISATATGTLANTATVAPPAGTTDPTPGDNSATDTDTLNPDADLAISKTDGSASATPGSPITYTIVASNAGPSAVTGATVADTIPATITGATWICAGAGGATCPASGSGNISATVNIPVGGTATFTVTGTVSASATGILSNTATIAAPAGTTDPTPGNNSATDSDTLSPQADLMVSKTDGSATATPGGTITYTIVASNAGPSAVTGATVADTIPASITGATWTCVGTGGATCPASGSGNISATVNIPVGGNATFTVTGTVSASATGTLANTATIAAPAGTTDPTPGNNSATDSDTLSPQADLMVSKTDGSASATPGGTITYTIVASNAGPSAVTGATVADTIPASITGATWTCVGTGGATCPASGSGNISATVNIPVGGNATFTVTGTVSASATGTLSNTATIAAPAGTTDPTPGNNSATDSDTLSGSADIEAHKTGPATVTASAAIAYNVVVTNHGPSDASAATFSDTVPAGITAVSANCGTPTGGAVCGAVNVAGNAVTSTITTLPSGASVTFTIDGTAPADPGLLSNTASAQPPAGITDPAPANNSSSVSTTVDASADVSIVKTGPTTLASGAPISYTLVVSNAGPSAADGATYADAVPAAITGVTASCGSPGGGATCAAPTVAGNDVSGSVPTLPAGGSVTITISGTAPFGSQSFTNTATVTAPVGVPDPNSANNSSSVTTSIGAAADIALTKTVDNTAPNVGQTVTFTIIASNAGPNDASGVAVTDSLPFGFGLVSATPSVGTYTPATGLWTIGALANGDSATLLIVASIDVPGALTNTVAVSASDQPDPNTSNNSAGASVNAGATADIAVAKTVDDATPNVGATITYTITASNGGPNDATGVEVTDNLPAGTTFVSATPSQGTYTGGVWSVGALANGANATLAISATVDAPGSIVNTATITHEDQFDPVGANNQAGTTINGQQADLGVTKTVDDAAPNVGDTVTFTVTVHNSGPSDATGVALSDALPAGLVLVSATPSQGTYDNLAGVWTVGMLTAAGSTSSATLTIVADVAAAGPMTNTASVSASDQPDPNGANNSASASLNGNPLADLAVVKSGPATVTPGEDVVYTIVVTNNGPSDATNAVVADPTPAGLVFVSNTGACTTTYPCSLASLASGASATITTTYTVPADYAGANPIVNTASASATEPDPDTANNQSSASTGVGAGNADLSIVKTGPSAVASDGAIAYTLLITNNGPSPANGASYNDALPAGITAIVAACGGEAGGAACGAQPVVSGNTVSGTIGNLPSGGSVLVTIDGTVPTGPVTLSNTATVAPPAGVNDPNPADNSSTVVTDVSSASADLAVLKTGPASAVAGGSITYTLTVTNNGPDVATAVQIADPTPAGLAFVSASIPCAGGFPCALGDMAPGASTIVTVTYTIDAGVSGSVTNTATVSSGTPDPDSANNQSSVITPVVPAATSADLVLVKTGPATATPGANVAYALQVQNAGPDAAVNVVLDDPTPANLTFISASAPCAAGFPCNLGTLASGAGTIVTVTYAVAPAATGSVTNSASVASTTPDPNLGNNASSATTPLVVVVTSANLAIAKSGPASAAPGDTVAYTVVVTNAGPDAAANAVVNDATPPGLVFVGNTGACTTPYPCALGTLATGASATITSTYLVPASYAGANPVVNLAGVVSDTPDPDGTDNVATASTIVIAPAPSADLRIAKSGPAGASAGTAVTYTIVVNNDGPDTVADAVLADPTPAGLAFVSASAPCSSGFPCTLPPLANGASTTLTATYLVQADFQGDITNVASVASSTVPDPTPNNNASTATTVVAGAPVEPTQVPVDARWMLLLMSALLLVVGSAAARRRR